jgi:hypothetical protein
VTSFVSASRASTDGSPAAWRRNSLAASRASSLPGSTGATTHRLGATISGFVAPKAVSPKLECQSAVSVWSKLLRSSIPPTVTASGAVAGGTSRRSPSLPAATITLTPCATSLPTAASTGFAASGSTGSPPSERLTTRTPSDAAWLSSHSSARAIASLPMRPC